MSFAKCSKIIAVQILFFSVTTLAYECVDDSPAPGRQVFEEAAIEGHCVNSARQAWVATPTYFIQVVPWLVDDQPIDLPSFYGVLISGMWLWGQYDYQKFTNPPGHYVPEHFLSPFSGDGISTVSFVNDIGEACNTNDDILGCHASRRGTRLTSGFGGIYKRAESDIFIVGGGWSLPGFTNPCSVSFVPDIRATINHEIGHGLGTAHMIAEGSEPRPVMNPSGGCHYQPLPKEMSDVDYLYEMAFPLDGGGKRDGNSIA